ncbi:transposase [Streptomyces sp. TG1A-8]|uniref:IS701 family transposase n=1 Tax=Streptomyces sp. TG1A-8 TaxID=3051385 RepID=UPI00265BC2CB|nr:transposase [Streptomyces sp. TG1A-8]MDO0925214.1 transposase [Streptomyces sp. TG1A-8]
MRGSTLHTEDTRRHENAAVRAHDRGVVLTELCSFLFASLPRADQRRKGVEYLRGLLEAEGRKSIRNIARLIGGRATEQNLHHFISSSTWDWGPVRETLANHLVRVAPPQAWVVRPTVIPKTGEHSVGVDRRFIPSLGQVLNAQQAIGVWSTSDEVSMPVNWRLHLSQAWLDDVPRRKQVSIPESVNAQTLGACAVETLLEPLSAWRLPVRPVVMDAREMDAMRIVRRLRAAGLPFVVRVDSTVPLCPAESAPAGHSADALPAQQILDVSRNLRRPVMWTDHGGQPGLRTSLVAGVRVRVPSPGRRLTLPGRRAAGGEEDLLLLGAGTQGRRWPREFWLTDRTAVPPALPFRLSRLTRRVDQDFTEIADKVGIRDFAGRSFDGWHRHVTLASAAHAVVALARTGDRQLRCAS